jgi:hypothetical protein
VARRPAPGQQLPERFGLTGLAVFARTIVEGYQQCIGTLAGLQSPRAIGQAFDITDVAARVAFGLRQGDVPRVSIAQQDDEEGRLIEGRIALEFERLPTAIGVTLTLIAPGFVLAASARDAFIERAQKSARDIADQFRDHDAIDYVGAIMRPQDPRRIVVTLWTEKPGDPFRYLATWPVRVDGVERHFVFRCREDKEKLGDIKEVMRATSSMGEVTVTNTMTAGVMIPEDTYEQYNRFFRAARVWRTGVTQASG